MSYVYIQYDDENREKEKCPTEPPLPFEQIGQLVLGCAGGWWFVTVHNNVDKFATLLGGCCFVGVFVAKRKGYLKSEPKKIGRGMLNEKKKSEEEIHKEIFKMTGKLQKVLVE